MGQHTCEIQQVCDKFLFRSCPSGHATEFSVGQGPQKALDMFKGDAISVVPSWGDGGASLICLGWYEGDGRATPRTKRFFRGGQMVLTSVSGRGTSIQRAYTRQAEARDAKEAHAVGPPDEDWSGAYDLTELSGDIDAFFKDVDVGKARIAVMRHMDYCRGCGLYWFMEKAPMGGYIVTTITPGNRHSGVCRINMDIAEDTQRFCPPFGVVHTGTCTWLPGGKLHCELRHPVSGTRFLRISKPDPDTFIMETCGLHKHVPLSFTYKKKFPLLMPNLAAPVNVDFSGHWQLEEIRDVQYWEEQLAWHGLGSARIFMQRRGGYNVGRDFLEIWQNHDVISINAPECPIIYVRTDGSPAPCCSFDPIRAGFITSKKNLSKVTTQFCPDGRRLAIHVQRYQDNASTELIMEMEGEKLLLVCCVVEGRVSRKVFKRTSFRDIHGVPGDFRG